MVGVKSKNHLYDFFNKIVGMSVVASITAVAIYVADKILETEIQESVWDKARAFLFPPKDYRRRLIDCIEKTIIQYDKAYGQNIPPGHTPFYKSEVMFANLTKYILLDKLSIDQSKNLFSDDPRIIYPTKEELDSFYTLFFQNIKADNKLKKKYYHENYQQKIFQISEQLGLLHKKADAIKSDTEVIKDQGGRIESKTSEIIRRLATPDTSNKAAKELTAKMPLLSGQQVVQRRRDVDDLHERLSKNKNVVLVNGMGGIGKTTLAQIYLTEYYQSYKHIAWVSMTSQDFINDFINTPGLAISLKINKTNKSPEEIFHEMIMALKSRPHATGEQSLLVLDNAEESIMSYRDHLPNPPHWHILATSRINLPDFDAKELDFMNEEEAVGLFRLYYKNGKLSDDNIREIVSSLEYHTLTIEILAEAAEHDGLDLNETLNAINDDYPVEVRTRHNTDKIKRITSYLVSIFQRSHLEDDERWLLSRMPYLPPDNQSIEIIKAVIPQETDIGYNYKKLLYKIVNKGWCLYSTKTQEYRLHRIISDVLRITCPLSEEEQLSLVSNMADLLKLDQTKDNPVDKFVWIPYGRNILDKVEFQHDSEIGRLQSHLGLTLKALGDYEGSKSLLEKAMYSAEQNFGESHPTTAIRYSNLALVLQDLGDYEGAKDLLEKAVNSDEQNFGESHPTTAISYSNLALVFKDLSDYEGAKNLLEKAVNSAEQNFGESHPTTAISYSNLATVFKALGDYEGAKSLLEKAVISDEKNFGESHPTTAISYSNLALVLKDLGDYARAKELLEKAICSDEQNFGESHPTTAIRYSNLALVLQDLGDYEGAKDLLEKAMYSDEQNFGESHPRTAISYSNLATVLKNLGDYKGAKSLLEKAVISDEKNFGKEHPTTAIRYSNLALVLQGLGQYIEAKSYLRKASAIMNNAFGKEHPSSIIVHNNLSQLLKIIESQKK